MVLVGYLSAIKPECRWLNGPAFLLLPEEFWPQTKLSSVLPEPVNEEVVESYVFSINPGSRNVHFLDPARFSSFVKVLRITAYVLRFVRNCKSKV